MGACGLVLADGTLFNGLFDVAWAGAFSFFLSFENSLI